MTSCDKLDTNNNNKNGFTFKTKESITVKSLRHKVRESRYAAHICVIAAFACQVVTVNLLKNVTSEDPTMVIFWRGFMSACLGGALVISKNRIGHFTKTTTDTNDESLPNGAKTLLALLRSLLVHYSLYLTFSVLCMGDFPLTLTLSTLLGVIFTNTFLKSHCKPFFSPNNMNGYNLREICYALELPMIGDLLDVPLTQATGSLVRSVFLSVLVLTVAILLAKPLKSTDPAKMTAGGGVIGALIGLAAMYSSEVTISTLPSNVSSIFSLLLAGAASWMTEMFMLKALQFPDTTSLILGQDLSFVMGSFMFQNLLFGNYPCVLTTFGGELFLSVIMSNAAKNKIDEKIKAYGYYFKW